MIVYYFTSIIVQKKMQLIEREPNLRYPRGGHLRGGRTCCRRGGPGLYKRAGGLWLVLGVCGAQKKF